MNREFRSLPELLAGTEVCQSVKNAALVDAIKFGRLELVEPLLQHGAELKSIPLIDVLRVSEPRVIRLFLDLGADVKSGFPFALAFGERVHAALRAFVEYKKAHPGLSSELQEQLDGALRYFCREGNLKWMTLLMGAGGNPRTTGPSLYSKDDPKLYVSSLQAASSTDNIAVLKSLKPDPLRDDLAGLLGCAALNAQRNTIRYLLELGAKPNNKANGGSSAVDMCLHKIHLGQIGSLRIAPILTHCHVRDALAALSELLEGDAVWKPDDGLQMKSVRRTLYGCEPRVTIEFLKLLVKYKACAENVIHELVSAPRMRKHLSSEGWWLSRLGLRQYRER